MVLVDKEVPWVHQVLLVKMVTMDYPVHQARREK